LLALHGHIHESPEMSGCWTAHIGNTICVQPGEEELRFRCVLMEIVEARGVELMLFVMSRQGKLIRRVFSDFGQGSK
jgi:Icc-related predicted phosphoesterase